MFSTISMTTFFVVLFTFMLIKHAMDTRAKQQADKLKLIETAIKDGNLDAQAKEDLMVAFTGRRPSSPPRQQVQVVGTPYRVGGLVKFIAFIGWVALCVGIAFVILTLAFEERGVEIPAVLLSCVGFGLVTYPFVIRELQAPVVRRQPSEQRP